MSQVDDITQRRKPASDVSNERTLTCLADREIESIAHFRAGNSASAQSIMLSALTGDGVRTLQEVGGIACVTGHFEGGPGSYQMRLALAAPMRANGVGVRMQLRRWKRINYIAVGYTIDGFKHVKAVNPIDDTWFDFMVGHNDLAWGWLNNWECPAPCEISDIRLYIKGEPEDRGFLDVSDFYAWLERDTPVEVFADSSAPVPPRVMYAVRAYQKKCFRTYEAQARTFMETGVCPLYGGVELDWSINESEPAAFTETGTYQYSFHAQHPATILMLQGLETGEVAPIMAARDQISLWLENSFFRVDENTKYAWYDHGTAERCLAMVQMYALGQEYGFDYRFMERLRLAIFRHAQLLASEAFYAGHQLTRYHNHAWFQDLTLLAVCLAFPSWKAAHEWTSLAIWRLEDQFEKLIVREGSYAIFVENSVGYHHGVQRIVEFAGNLALLSGRETVIPEVARELLDFADFFRYPDTRRTITQGDTFREWPNVDETILKRGLVPYGKHSVTVLPTTGYGIVKDNHDGIPFMLVMLATALSRTHKHEDNLSITLFFDGLEWLIDPSFYSHEYSQPIPAYLRSSAAHNVLHLPDRSYSIDPFHAGLDGHLQDGRYSFTGWHDACEGAYVTRHVAGSLGLLDLHIVDAVTISQGETTTGQLMLHCGEGVRAQVSGNTVTLRHIGSEYELLCELPSEQITVKRGVVTDEEVRGITGHTFMIIAEIDTIETTIDLRQPLTWRIYARLRS